MRDRLAVFAQAETVHQHHAYELPAFLGNRRESEREQRDLDF